MSGSRFLGSTAVVLLAGLFLGNLWSHSRPRADLGRWGIVVLQSDDWGLEGWFPDAAAAGALTDITKSLPPRLAPYATSTLESAGDVDSLALFLEELLDADGLPAVLQANTIVAGADLGPLTVSTRDLPLHRSGNGEGGYFRPGLDAAVDRAVRRGVWWPELHGLTHFDLPAYARARQAGDSLARTALAHGTLAYEGWLRHSELSGHDPARASQIAAETVTRFRERFDRDPTSMIAPDYRWGPEDEDAWEGLGLRVVQAKREQIDDALKPGTLLGRIRKVLARRRDHRRHDLAYLDRPARLEPYGNQDLACSQGAKEAAGAVKRAWRMGEAGIVSIHRVQLVNMDPRIERAGRVHLRALVERLAADRPIRFVVDAELEQLLRRGVSVLTRGPWLVVRNYSPRPVAVSPRPGDPPRLFAPGTHVVSRTGI